MGFLVKSNDHPPWLPRRCDRPNFQLRYVTLAVELESGISFLIPVIPVDPRDRYGLKNEGDENDEFFGHKGIKLTVECEYDIILSIPTSHGPHAGDRSGPKIENDENDELVVLLYM